ncbi:MAG TPA: SRPBCC family protein [Longimicrobiales bacterium]
MGIRIEERFEIAAAPERVWSYLIDPSQVVRCLPGAELLETAEDGSFVGRVKVKVGPVLAAYKGKARFVELDAAARRARLTGEGQEASGAGSARMTMTSSIEALDGGGAAVRVEVDVDVVGKLAQFGRGMIEEVSRQIFRQFSACVRAALEQPAPAASVAPAASSAATSPTPAAVSDVASAAASPGQSAGVTAGAPTAATSPAPPLRVLPLLFAALRAWFRRVFARAA